MPLKARHDDLGAHWQSLISDYTQLDFSHNRDLLPALAGIVQREMHRRKDDLYIAGMWRRTLLEDLAFNGKGHRTEPKAPTWSWACLSGQIYFSPYRPLAALELPGVQLERAGPANIGEVNTAIAWARGNVLTAKLGPRCTEDHYDHHPFLSMPYKLEPKILAHVWVDEAVAIRYECCIPIDLTPSDVVDILVLSACTRRNGATEIALHEVAPGRFRSGDRVHLLYGAT